MVTSACLCFCVSPVDVGQGVAITRFQAGRKKLSKYSGYSRSRLAVFLQTCGQWPEPKPHITRVDVLGRFLAHPSDAWVTPSHERRPFFAWCSAPLILSTWTDVSSFPVSYAGHETYVQDAAKASLVVGIPHLQNMIFSWIAFSEDLTGSAAPRVAYTSHGTAVFLLSLVNVGLSCTYHPPLCSSSQDPMCAMFIHVYSSFFEGQ